jgi:hypothetical protein
MFLVVQGSCSVLHNDALGFIRDIGRSEVSVARGSFDSAAQNKGLVASTHGSLLQYWHLLVCGQVVYVLARRHELWIVTTP